ncbi:MAG TPA: chorismate mutase [Pyrinomonadaceae bacterium]|nr:chorismate mutase [Pyrinomonadaceae bacterium]
MRIEELREEIDTIDAELLRLMNRRALVAVQVGALKSSAGLPIHDPQRERTVLSRACRANDGPLDDDAVSKIFRLIIRESRRLEAADGLRALEQRSEVL